MNLKCLLLRLCNLAPEILDRTAEFTERTILFALFFSFASLFFLLLALNTEFILTFTTRLILFPLLLGCCRDDTGLIGDRTLGTERIIGGCLSDMTVAEEVAIGVEVSTGTVLIALDEGRERYSCCRRGH